MRIDDAATVTPENDAATPKIRVGDREKLKMEETGSTAGRQASKRDFCAMAGERESFN